MSGIYIVGGGASGLFAAICAARRNKKVTILEHKDKPGKKILATGNGKCNYTNLVQKEEFYRSSNPAFAGEVIRAFDVNATVDFFKEIGIYHMDRNGYLYPNSGQAASVLEVLLLEAERTGVTIECNAHVQKIDKNLSIYTADRKYQAEGIILAAGGKAAPAHGSDGSGLSIARELGHNILTPLPALVQLKSGEKYFKTLSGVRTEAEVRLFIDKQMKAFEKGEVLLAEYGLSGIPVMQISRYAAEALGRGSKVTAVLDFLPFLTKEELKEMLYYRLQRNVKETLEEAFLGLLNKKLAYVAIKESKLDPYHRMKDIKDSQLTQLVNQLKEWKVPITDTHSFEHAQVMAGGIDTKEINPVSMESKLIKGLYFAGEIVDVDGTCGGYNLQWAWSSGHAAGTHI
jgi:predicted Rossmann fold flavoprotein